MANQRKGGLVRSLGKLQLRRIRVWFTQDLVRLYVEQRGVEKWGIGERGWRGRWTTVTYFMSQNKVSWQTSVISVAHATLEVFQDRRKVSILIRARKALANGSSWPETNSPLIFSSWSSPSFRSFNSLIFPELSPTLWSSSLEGTLNLYPDPPSHQSSRPAGPRTPQWQSSNKRIAYLQNSELF